MKIVTQVLLVGVLEVVAEALQVGLVVPVEALGGEVASLAVEALEADTALEVALVVALVATELLQLHLTAVQQPFLLIHSQTLRLLVVREARQSTFAM